MSETTAHDRPEQGVLVVLPDPVPEPPGKAGRPRQGRVEKAVARSANAAGLNDRKHAAAVALAKALGRAIDVSERRSKPYEIAQNAPRLAEVLDSLGLLGPSGGDDDEQPELDGLGAATMGDS